MKLKNLILVVAALALATAASAQQRRGGFGMMGGMAGNPAMLLGREDVQEDLKLSDDQKTKLSGIRDGMRDKMREAMQSSGVQFGPNMSDDDRKKIQEVMGKVMAGLAKESMAVLNDDQKKRIKEIDVQLNGARVLTSADYQKDLSITDDQKAKIDTAKKTHDDANQAVIRMIMSQELEREEGTKKIASNDKQLGDDITKLLTDDQKKKLKEMEGTKKFVEKKPDN